MEKFMYIRNVADELVKALLLEEAVSPTAVADALFASVTGRVPLVQALIDAGAATAEIITRYLARTEAPFVRQVTPMQELVERLPVGMCARLSVVPIRRDNITGTIDVAVADGNDPHPAAELAFHFGMPVRVIRAPLAAIDEALRRSRMRSLPPPAHSRVPSYAPPPQLSPPSTELYDSRPHSVQPTSRRMNTLPPPMFERAPASVPPPPPSPPPLALTTRVRRDTPTWGTPVHAVGVEERPASDAPEKTLGSEIPIPLTRRNYTAERGGTQRPPPPRAGQASQLGDGMEYDPASFRAIVEIGTPYLAAEFPAPPPVPSVTVPSSRRQAPLREDAHPLMHADVGAVLASLRIAQTRDEILELVLTGARMLALKVGLFVVKRGGYVGWACSSELGDRIAFQNLLLQLDADSVLDAAVREGIYLGPIRKDRVHASLLAVMGGASRDVAIVPIRVVGKIAVVILADELGDTMLGTRRLEEIARAAGDAFARIVKSRR